METVLTSQKAVVGLPADAHATTAGAYGAAIPVAEFDEGLIELNAGVCGSSGTVDISLVQSETSGGAKTAITGAAFTQVTEANDETIYVGRVRFDKPGANFLHVKKVVGTAACDFSVNVLLMAKRGVKPVAQVNTKEFDVGIAA